MLTDNAEGPGVEDYSGHVDRQLIKHDHMDCIVRRKMKLSDDAKRSLSAI